MNNSKGKFRLIAFSLALSILMLCAKFIAYLFTHSNIVLSDALESIINVVASGFASFSIYLASQPRDVNHPYGHGKVEFFASGIEGLLILMAGALVLIKTIYSFFLHPGIQALDAGALILAGTAVINFIFGRYLVKKGNNYASMTLVAEGKHLITDNFTSLIGISGLIIILVFDMPEIDNFFSLVIAFFMIRSGYRLVRPAIAGLMDETDKGLIEKIAEILNAHRQEDWIDVHNMRIVKYGADIHIDCHATIPYYYSLLKSHDIISQIEQLLRMEYPQQIEVFIHADPCVPEINCAICQVSNCAVRQHAFEKKLYWTTELLMKNQKHRIDSPQTEPVPVNS